MAYPRPWYIIVMVYLRPWCIITMGYNCHGVCCAMRRGVGRIDGILRGRDQNRYETSELGLNRTLVDFPAK